MSINPGSDIIMDVMRAADPARAQATTQRLEALAAGAPIDPTDFSAALAQATSAPMAQTRQPTAVDMRDKLASSSRGGPSRTATAERAFEASVLTSFVKELLPQGASQVFGQGTAGDVWKSMLAEQIATQLARSGRMGIAKSLFATHAISHPMHVDGSTGRTANSAPKAAQASENPLSVPSEFDSTQSPFLFKPQATL